MVVFLVYFSLDVVVLVLESLSLVMLLASMKKRTPHSYIFEETLLLASHKGFWTKEMFVKLLRRGSWARHIHNKACT